ncbi:hypothetical protein CLV99_1656 [Sphingobacterium yanglingense]|uniref:WD40 repeat protein n=2 Tax=Sphingobacterium yanglingense TaxID=1437280 RepID=A0A4V3DE94_9SPHI|nr:hypothetical protein CLV99_1656 [Sphingobacterium yanglingense]
MIIKLKRQIRTTMNKAILLSTASILFSDCTPSTRSRDYFGQAHPDTIPVIFAPDIISKKGRLEHGISFTPSGMEVAFGILNKDDYSGKIFYSEKVNEKWTEPLLFEPLKNGSVYLPYFSPDGQFMLYAQSKSTIDYFNTDIWTLKKINGVWSSPTVLSDTINSKSREANASMTYDGTIYFSSNRNCYEKDNCHTADLFYSKREGNLYQKTDIVSELSSSNDEESVFISPEEDYLIFCRHTDNKTGVDLYISYRDINNNWIKPQRVDSTINSKDWERRPFVSIDNKFLFFTRLQIVNNEIVESDIFWVGTSKLFKPFVFHPIPDIVTQIGKKFEIPLPKDYFKDIDDKKLRYSINVNQLEWVNFDPEKMKLSGLPIKEGEFELILTATDNSSNRTDSKIRINVKTK